MLRDDIKRFLCVLAMLLPTLTSVAPFAGCASAKKESSPQQKEEMRQKMIKNAERQRREG
jgi:hypothetical protein